MLLMLNDAILVSAVMLKEGAVGTIEQLPMSRRAPRKFILSNVALLLVLLSAMALLALTVIRVAFGVPGARQPRSRRSLWSSWG